MTGSGDLYFQLGGAIFLACTGTWMYKNAEYIARWNGKKDVEEEAQGYRNFVLFAGTLITLGVILQIGQLILNFIRTGEFGH